MLLMFDLNECTNNQRNKIYLVAMPALDEEHASVSEVRVIDIDSDVENNETPVILIDNNKHDTMNGNGKQFNFTNKF